MPPVPRAPSPAAATASPGGCCLAAGHPLGAALPLRAKGMGLASGAAERHERWEFTNRRRGHAGGPRRARRPRVVVLGNRESAAPALQRQRVADAQAASSVRSVRGAVAYAPEPDRYPRLLLLL